MKKREVFKVRITSCHNEVLWYKDRIGEEFEVETNPHTNTETKYMVRKRVNGHFLSIWAQDCEKI